MEQIVMGRTLVVASSAISSACIAASAGRASGLLGGLKALPVLRVGGSKLFSSCTAFAGSSSGVVRVSNNVDLSGSFAGQESERFGLQRRTFVKSCAASWLMCTAAMAGSFGTASAQPASSDSDASSNLVTFYNYALAFNPAKGKLALEEKNIKYVEKKIDLFNGDSLEPWYLKINPQASAPTLVVGSENITQSVEIIRWADRQGSPLGGDSVDRAFVDEWLNKVNAWDGNLFVAANTPGGAALKVSTEYKIKVAEANAKKNPDMADLYKEKISTMTKNLIDNPNNKAVSDDNRKQLVALLDEANARLATNKYLAGPAYTMADVIFTPVLYRIYQLKFDSEYLDPRPNIKNYYQELEKRPSYKAVFGTSDNPLAAAGEVIPAVGKVVVDQVTGKYNQ
ncbi:hypothetical protein M758_2G238000 [Ceratodon purpureus]|nr:hypothetical protein M758_2G238000 [Ceratodon purpureus]